ncbi:hypothetical protein SDJN02_07242, partial [Cucurbita argyrosperma subsp. argyrosperma]
MVYAYLISLSIREHKDKAQDFHLMMAKTENSVNEANGWKIHLWIRRLVIFEGRAGDEADKGEQGQKLVLVLEPRSKQAASS